MRTSFGRKICLSLVILTLAAGGRVSAVEMNLDTVFSDGAVSPYNLSGPWLEYRVDNIGPSSVLFTLRATASMTGLEKIIRFYFNFSDTLTLADLDFSAPIINSGSFTVPTIGVGVNSFKADGDGRYDVLLSFDTSGGLSSYFGAGDSLSYTLNYTGSGTMTDASFAFFSQQAGLWGPYYAAALIQATPDGGLGGAWIAATTVVPEPAAAAMLIAGLAVLGLRQRRG